MSAPMSAPLITLAWLRERNACWKTPRIRRALAGRRGVRWQTVAKASGIPAQDRVWVLCHVLHADRCFVANFAYEACSHRAANFAYEACSHRACCAVVVFERHMLEVELPQLVKAIEEKYK